MTDPDEVLRAAAEWIWLPDGTERSGEDYLLVAMPTWTENPTQVLRTTSERPPATLLAEVVEQVRRWGRPSVAWWVSGASRPDGLADALLAAGAEPEETVEVLARPLEDLPGTEASVEVRLVEDGATLRDFATVEIAAFGGSLPPEDAAVVELARLRRELAAGRAASTVGYVDGEPVTAGGVSLADGFARMWGGATVPAARGRGAYRALLAARAAWGLAHGAHTALVKGRVETSGPILRRLGFTAYGEERSYRLGV